MLALLLCVAGLGGGLQKFVAFVALPLLGVSIAALLFATPLARLGRRSTASSSMEVLTGPDQVRQCVDQLKKAVASGNSGIYNELRFRLLHSGEGRLVVEVMADHFVQRMLLQRISGDGIHNSQAEARNAVLNADWLIRALGNTMGWPGTMTTLSDETVRTLADTHHVTVEEYSWRSDGAYESTLLDTHSVSCYEVRDRALEEFGRRGITPASDQGVTTVRAGK